MKAKLRILHLEDNTADAVLIQSLLDESGLNCDVERVQTREHFVRALEAGGYDLIFSDFTLPGFNGITALTLARDKRPNVPFLFVSGTLGEDIAVETLKSGATDYVLKQRLSRLMPAVRRALAEKEAEKAMIQSELKYRLLFECLGEAAFLMDAGSGRILDTNREAERLLKRNRREILGSNLDEFHASATLQKLRQCCSRSAARPPRIDFQGELFTLEHKAIPVEITAAPITLFDHELILGLYRDITERKKADEQIEKLSAELEHHLRSRTGELDATRRQLHFYARVVQHLRTRLQMLSERVDSVGEMIAQDPPKTSDQTIIAIQHRLRNTDRLIDRLLTLTRFGSRTFQIAALDMTAIAKNAFEKLRQPLLDQEIRFELEPLPAAHGDAEAIQQVFTELLGNALKFSQNRRPARIFVHASLGEIHNYYYISDNGVGFTMEEVDGFFDLHEIPVLNSKWDGSGIGLEMVRQIVQRHGGQLGVEGHLDDGAVVCFSLPRRNE